MADINTSTSPSNWPMWCRLWILFNISFYNLLGNAWSSGLSPVFALIIEEFGCSQSEASDLATYSLLMLGISNIFALPLTSLVGKRYTILASLTLFLACNIWSGEASNYKLLRNSRILGGLAGGIIEALGPTVIAETFHDHQLARAMVVYVGFLAAGSAVGPLVSGAVGASLHSWRWYLRIISIAIGLNLWLSILMLPETTSDKSVISGEAVVEQDVSDPKPESKAVENICNPLSAEISVGEAPSIRLRKEWILRSFSSHYVRLEWRRAFGGLIRPFQLLLAPQVLLTVFIFGLTIGWTVIVSIILAMVYAQPPLLWGPRSIGMLNFGPLLGLLIGLPIGGYFADSLFIRSARKNNGVPDPAARLPVVFLGGLVSPAGCLVLGYGLRHPDRWIQVCAGWCMLALGLTSSANVLLAYSVNSIPSRAGDIGVLINLMKNGLAFGVSYASISWMQATGPGKQFAIMGALLWFGYLFVFPVWKYSDTLLRRCLVFI